MASKRVIGKILLVFRGCKNERMVYKLLYSSHLIFYFHCFVQVLSGIWSDLMAAKADF